MNKWFCGFWRYVDTRIHDVGRPLTKGNWPIELVVASRLKSILSLDYKYLQVSHNCISTKISVNKYNNVNYELINYGLPYIFILHNVCVFFFFRKNKNPYMWSENDFAHWEPFKLYSLPTLSKWPSLSNSS